MQRLKGKASRIFKGKEKEEERIPEKALEPAFKPNSSTVHHDRPRTANVIVAPWEAQKPPPLEQSLKQIKKKTSTFSLRKERPNKEVPITSDASAPPVPPIPPMYNLFPNKKLNNPSNIPPQPSFTKQRPETGRSALEPRAVPQVSQPTGLSSFLPLKSPSKVTSVSNKSRPSTESPVSSVPQPSFAPVSPSEETLFAIKKVAQTLTKIDTETTSFLSPGKRPTSTTSSASSILQHSFAPKSPSEESLLAIERPKPTTFGVPNEVWEARYADHPAIIRFMEYIHHGGPVIEELVYPPGIPASEYERLKAQYEATGSPWETSKVKGKKSKSLPQCPSSYSFSTVTPFSHHQHEIPHSAPLEPHSPFNANRDASSSLKTLRTRFKSSSEASSPTHPIFAPFSTIDVSQIESNRKSFSSSWRSSSWRSSSQDKYKHRMTSSSSSSHPSPSGTSSLGRSSGAKIKPKKSLRDIFKASSTSPSEQQPGIGYITRPVLVPQPGPDSEVPPLPATVKFTKPPGPPPKRPQRPHEEVDWELIGMRDRGLTRMGFEGSNRVEMGIRASGGEVYEQYSDERYVVKRTGRAMAIRDVVTDAKEFVEDI